jgi:hypothetical protein
MSEREDTKKKQGQTERSLSTVREYLDSGAQAMGSGTISAGIQSARNTRIKRERAFFDPTGKPLTRGSANSMMTKGPTPAPTFKGPNAVHAALDVINAYRVQCLRRRKDNIMRYAALIVCVMVIIFALLGMAYISKKTQGQQWEQPLQHSALLIGGNAT